mmetsp:Transcript_30761/g.70389  ORF Transcript_30761/g.70389 Transcript_30761/m.70389 type:complete len:203 (+) Transcript_30761:226-834(+)
MDHLPVDALHRLAFLVEAVQNLDRILVQGRGRGFLNVLAKGFIFPFSFRHTVVQAIFHPFIRILQLAEGFFCQFLSGIGPPHVRVKGCERSLHLLLFHGGMSEHQGVIFLRRNGTLEVEPPRHQISQPLVKGLQKLSNLCLRLLHFDLKRPGLEIKLLRYVPRAYLIVVQAPALVRIHAVRWNFVHPGLTHWHVVDSDDLIF